MESFKIISASILLAIVYGICHDLITAHISLEYFTVGHPKLIESESPIHLALLWGTIATWWVGLLLGVVLAIAARYGEYPKLDFRTILSSFFVLILAMASTSLLAGIVGLLLAQADVIRLSGNVANEIAPARHAHFLIVAWAHSASYIVGCGGAILLSRFAWNTRSEFS